METEDYAELLARLCDTYQEIIPRFGGTVVQISGDGLLAIFGHPDTSEDDGRTAVMAALALHERVRLLFGEVAAPAPVRLHTGLHAGLVLLHEGDMVRGRFELHGGATNIASRLAAAAQPDEILVSHTTLGPDRSMFRTSALRVLTLRGTDKPILVFNVHGHDPQASHAATRGVQGRKPFIGRDQELRHLASMVRHAASGEPRFVSVFGPPGVGKTRIVSHLLDRVGCAFQVHRGDCGAHPEAEPLQPFLQILRAALGCASTEPGKQASSAERALAALGPALEPHAGVLLQLLASETGAGLARSAISAAYKALIARLAEDRPVALFIDDWHRADDAARRLLESLRDLAGCPLLVLLTMRGDSGDDGFDAFERMALTPFNTGEAEAATRQMLPHADAFLIEDICIASGGNPLFIEELCHSAAYGEEDFRTHRGTAWLDILVQSRFARLNDACAGLLAAAAVAGNVIPTWLLEQVTGHKADDPLIRALAEEDFIFPGELPGTLRFKHGLTRDIIYDTIGLHERRALHLQMAEALRAHGAITGEEEFHEALAYHYGAGGDVSATAVFAELAGNKAMERGALDRARVHYRAALDALGRLPPTPDTSRGWLRIARWFGLASTYNPAADQLPIFAEAVQRARARARGDMRSIAYAEYWLAYISFVIGRDRQAAEACERALAALPVDDGLEAHIVLLLGQSRARGGHYESAAALLDQGLEALRDRLAEPQAQLGFAYGMSCKAMMLADLGRFGEARDRFEEALAAVAGSEHPIEAAVLSNYVHLYLWRGAIDEALDTAARAERVCARLKAFYMYVRNRAAGSYARWITTGNSGEIDQLIETATWLEENGSEQLMASFYARLAEMLAADGQREKARHYAACALKRVRQGDCLGAGAALRALARLEAEREDGGRSERYLRRALRAAQSRDARPDAAITTLCAAEIALARGAPEKAAVLLDQASAVFEELEMRRHAAEAARLRARIEAA